MSEVLDMADVDVSPTIEERFWQRVKKTNTCWEWTGYVTPSGYGRLFIGTKAGRCVQRPAHRIGYELSVGPIPDSLPLDHLCRNRKCVNPDHLEPVAQAENTRRGLMRNGDTCRTGRHPWPASARERDDGSQACRECERAGSAGQVHREFILGVTVRENFECPTCGALIGQPCRSLISGGKTDAHTSRKDAAMQGLHRAIADALLGASDSLDEQEADDLARAALRGIATVAAPGGKP